MILAYDYPPYISVGGLRPQNWFQNFKKNGVYPILVTRQWNNIKNDNFDYIRSSKYKKIIIEENNFGTIINAPFYPNLSNKILLKYGENKFILIRKIISILYFLLENLTTFGNKSQIYSAANNYISENEIHLIIATGDPFILFKYASLLSKKNNIPWIADYRDPWVGNVNRSNIFLKKINKYLQKKYVKSASKITTVSKNLKIQLKKEIGNFDINIILNGYDDKINFIPKNIKQSKSILSIGFMGSIYPWHPLETFINTVFKLHEEKKIELKINFYGLNNEKKIKELLNKKYPSIKKQIEFHKRNSNFNTCELIAENNLFLLFNDYYFLGTKLFNYIALDRKILFCFNDNKEISKTNFFKEFKNNNQFFENEQINILEKTNSGIIINDQKHLEKILIDMYNEFKKNKFIYNLGRDIEKYSRAHQTKFLCNLINKK